MPQMEIRPLLPILKEKARKEINEEPNRIGLDICAIREWLGKQPHLKSVNPSDQWIVSFLRGNKYSLEKTKSKLEMYYTLRSLLPEIFCNRNPFDPIAQDILKLGIFLPLTTLEREDSRRITLNRLNIVESSNNRLIDVFKVTFMIIEILILEDDNFVIAGKDLVVDLNGVGIRTFSQFTPAVAKQTAAISEKALPVRLNSSHLLNTSTAFESVYSMFRMILSEKWKKRFNVYSRNLEAMYDVIPRTILPKEYGGMSGTIQELTDYWKIKVESYSDYFLREEVVRSDEALRPGQAKTGSDLFGVEGSFRKLDVD
ncbi:alpha-tocopherol transfer protein-like [Maniola hyperantus]|uniref:alpha-tocopherol transfer protein-like n=1 Tax=Aphantopus hyperantus TaxID=2795564 RepID=UPI00156856AC|nr:alpha-tocopherol transfer protein-like [Maniola hyperantus]